MHDDKSLDSRARAAFLDLVLACAQACTNPETFRDLVRTHVRPLLPHRFSIAVLGSLSFDHLSIRHMVGIDYPAAFLASIPTQTKLRERPVIARWLTTREPLVIDPVRDRELLSPLEAREIDTFGLGRMAIHGQIDLSSNMASYFSFAGVAETVADEHTKFILRLIAPHLHAALTSLPSMSMADPAVRRLTPLERQLLIWLAAGRSNAEIATLRRRSAATVRNQLTVLFRKIQVKTRAEAVATVSSQSIAVRQWSE